MSKPKSVLLICGGGGFSWEGKVLSEELDKLGVDVVLAYPESSYEGRDYYVERHAYFTKALAHRGGYHFLKIVNGFFKNYFICQRILKENDCCLVIGVGTSNCIPMLLAARVNKKYTVFIESVTRTRVVSRACKVVRKFRLARAIYVQWPNLQNNLNDYMYVGSIL